MDYGPAFLFLVILYRPQPKLTQRRAAVVPPLHRRDVLSAERQDYRSCPACPYGSLRQSLPREAYSTSLAVVCPLQQEDYDSGKVDVYRLRLPPAVQGSPIPKVKWIVRMRPRFSLKNGGYAAFVLRKKPAEIASWPWTGRTASPQGSFESWLGTVTRWRRNHAGVGNVGTGKHV